MTLKEKFNSIDQSRITADQKAFLDKMKNVTKDFTLENKEVNDKVEGALDKMIASFKEKMPDAIKTSTKVVVPKTAKSKKTTKVVSKTTTPKRTVMSVAKEIRKEGESWADAQKRAKAMIKEDKADVSEVVKTELDRINKFINSRKELKGISGTNIKRDAVRTAKPRGARTVTRSGETSNQYGTFNNKLGRKYWESRDRHADRLAPNYPKDAPLLEDGGMVSEDLFENYEKQPKELSEIVNSYMEKFEEGDYDYQDSQNFLKEVESIGYTFDYGLDNEPYGLRPIGTKLKEYKLGGRVEEVYFFQADNKEIRDDFFEDLQNYMPDHSKTKLGDLSIQIFADKNDASNLMQMANSTNGVVFVEEKFAEGGYLTDPTFGTFQNQVYAKGGGFRFKNNRKYDVGSNWTNDHNQFDKGAEHEVQYRKRNKFELGGDFQSGVYAEKGMEVENLDLLIKKGYRFNGGDAFETYEECENIVNNVKSDDVDYIIVKVNSKYPYYAIGEKRNYELGGVMATDLAGHTGGALGTGDPSLLSGTSGTSYTGLVGETGAMSSGEMFMNGGGVKTKSTFRTNNSSLLEYANFEDGSYINLIKLNRPYKSGLSFAVSVQEFKDEQQVMLFKTLDKAKGKFDYLVAEAKEDKTLRDEGKTSNFELGGVMATDLAGHTGGSLGTGEPSLLSGTSGTGYTGLVGETGAMSSGEMFEYGGGLPNGVSQSYMVTEAFGNPAQHFANGGGLPAGAEQSYINYYLGEGSAQGIYKKGGSVENQYEGRTPKDIWDNLSQSQRNHFLHDHNKSEIQSTPSSLDEFSKKSYNFLPTKVKRSFEIHVATGQYKAGGMLNANERYVLEIKGLTGLRKEAIENYIAENNLSDNDVLNIVIGLGRKQLKGSDVASAVVGKKGNALSKEVIEFAKDNRGMKLEEGGNIDAFTLRMVKGTAGKPDEAMTEPRSVQFVKGGAVSQKEKREEYLANLSMLEAEVWDKIGANSGGQIRQDEKLLRKYAEGVGSVMEKEGVGYGSFDEEDYEYFQDENSHLLNEFLVWNNYYEPTMTKKEKAWRLKRFEDDVREKKKYSYVSNPEVITLNSTKRKSETESKSETDKKYIVNADIESVTVKKAGKEVTYSGKDVLNGANILKDGGGIEDKASYFSKNNVVSVKLKNGQTIKPANGYWVEKDATPIKKMETDGADENKPMSFEEFSKKLPDVYDVYYGEKGVVYKAKYNRWADRMSYYKNGRRTDKNLVSLKSAYDTYKLDFENKKFDDGGEVKSKDTWQNLLEDYGFKKSRSKYGIDIYKKRGYVATVDSKERNVELMFDDELIYEGYSVQGLLASLKDEFSSRYGANAKKMATGGKTTFKEKSSAIAKRFEGKRVEPKYQKDYGKVYSKEEAKKVGNKITGSMVAKEKMATGGKVEKIKVGDFLKKKGSNLKVKVIEVGNDWRSGYDTITIYNDVTNDKKTLVDWSDYEKTNLATGEETKKGTKGGIMILAKKIRKDGESWKDALKRAGQQLK